MKKLLALFFLVPLLHAQQAYNDLIIKSNLTVRGSATISNGVFAGESRLLGAYASDIPQDADVKISLIYDSPFAPLMQETIANVSTIRALTNYSHELFSGNNIVNADGYATTGDGGGGILRRVLNTGQTIDNGMIFPFSSTTSWLLERVRNGEPINVRWFGAKGDGLTDDTAAIQAAIDYSQSLADKPVVEFPEGRYVISSIVTTNVSLMSVGGKMSNGGTRNETSTSAILIHKVGATNDLLTLKVVGNPVPAVIGFGAIGNREQNQKNPLTISSVSDRLNFTVPTNGLPTAPATPTVWPYYGYCFFFSNEGRYIGSGLVTNINYTTGAIELVPQTDQYATLTSASYLLSPGFTVSFSETTGEYANFKSTTGVDSTKAGYSFLNITATQTNLISEVVLEDLKIERFHCGIRLGNQLFTYINRVWVNACSFAGIAAAFPGDSRDGVQSGLFLQGFYGSDLSWPTSATNSYDNSAYRATLYGYYGLESSAAIDDIRIDHTIHGVYAQNCIETQVNQLLTDNTTSHAIIFGGNSSGASRVNVEIGELQIRNVNSALYAATTTNVSYAIKTFGNYNQNLIHGASIVAFGSSGYFTAVFDTTGSGGRLNVTTLFTAAGATNSTLYSTTSTAYPIIDNYAQTSGTIQRDIGGSSQETLTTSTHTIYNDLVAHGSISAGTNKTTLAATGATSVDSVGIFYKHGADQSDGRARTDLTTKRSTWRIPNYTNASADFQVISAFATQTANSIAYGGIDGTLEAATSHTFYTDGTKGTLTGTGQLKIDATSSTTSTPLLVNVNGSLTRVSRDATSGLLSAGGTGAASALAPAYTTLTSGTTVTWTMDSSKAVQNAHLTLSTNATLSVSGIANGMTGVLIVQQDGSGGRTLALPANSKVVGGGAGAITLTTTAGAFDILSFTYNGTNYFWTYGKNFN